MASKDQKQGGGFFSSIASSLSNFGSAMQKSVNGLMGYEGLEVINPEGGTEDAAEEAQKGRWKQEDRDSYWKMMHKYIGSDVTSMVTLPVLIFEPMTMLQKMAELMEYSYLLDLADECEDPYMRLVYASSWFITIYYACQRTWKPFNPILGETYELVNHGGITFIAEQVSHHPPMSAGHAENDHFVYDITSKVKTKFLGNSLDIYPLGRSRVTLKRDGVVLDLVPPPSKVNNLIFGRTWVDAPGEMILTNLTTGDKVVLYFQPCGWFGFSYWEMGLVSSVDFVEFQQRLIEHHKSSLLSLTGLYSYPYNVGIGAKKKALFRILVPFHFKYCSGFFDVFVFIPMYIFVFGCSAGRYEVDGYVYNAAEEPKILMTGKWNESMSCQPCDLEGEPLSGTELKEVWKLADVPENDKYQYTHFAHKVNSFDTAPKKLLASDSRLRPDRYALEKGDLSKAGSEKSSLEERQRAEKKIREAKGHEFTPKWFALSTEIAPTPWGDIEVYHYNGKYDEFRASIDNSDSNEEVDFKSMEFKPWQYGNLASE
ncbi:hypothetical protein F0562_016314 [Nyssa sinensis]|uniref:Oxysterol-binding protein n=1 Tax=Nyssa sinensis TaxID=561372 RepID=A0A5J4ZN49_9ASTE|nr:hypothetical protein F0562_016314 [Nyssa sinensis]